jgi:hypothetical protein
LGFKTNLDPEPITYYIDSSFDSSILVLTMIKELLRSKYSNMTFYCHNLGGFDVVFILKILFEYNESIQDKDLQYTLLPILRDDKIIKLTIKQNKSSVTIVDSYCILNMSLKDLCKDFGLKMEKSVFPCKFATQDHLNYIGNTPPIDFYDDLTQEDYSKIYTDN